MTPNLESANERARRVLAILEAAGRLADPGDPLGVEARQRLPDVTGLSSAGVELGLCRHLETRVEPADLARLLARAGTAPRVHVLLSANVFVAVVRATALAAAASPSVCVRASRREAVMPSLLRRALDDARGWTFGLVDELSPSLGDEIHVYGRNETIADVARQCPPGVRLRGHGAGFGVALVDPQDAWAAEAISWDVVAFDQRGCLSPRVVFVDGLPAQAEAFASGLARELEHRAREVPRGQVSDEERQQGMVYRRTLEAVGRVHTGTSFLVGLDLSPRALILPPPAWHVHIVAVSGDEQLAALLRPWSSALTCVGAAGASRHSSLAKTLRILAPAARWLSLGSMQSPSLDGPVDLRGVL